MITYQELNSADAGCYDEIEMIAEIREIYEVRFADLNGISFHKKSVPYRRKDFCKWDNYTRWKEKFDLTNWHFFIAFDDGKPIGGAALCHHSKELHMLEGRSDLGVLWDIRVDSAYKGQGIGHQLFTLIKEKCLALGLRQLKIECQNNNVTAVDFYLRQGAALGAVNRYAYAQEADVADEVQFFMYLELGE